MRVLSRCVLIAAIGLLPCGNVGGDVALADENFCIENKVFIGSEKTPASESITIFHDGVVYDYLKKPAETIVLDQTAGRFILLDSARRVKAELSTKDVEVFTDQLQQRVAKQDDPMMRFLAAPKFTERFDRDSNELTLTSQWMSYRVLTEKATSPQIAAQYRASSDWYARLNTILHPGSKPPFARLVVNEAIGRHEATAREVHLMIATRKALPPKTFSVRSEHHLIEQVAGADLDRVNQTRQFMAIFKSVSFEKYRKAAD